MRTVQSVTSCLGCPHRQYYSGGTYFCTKTDTPLNYRDSIPEWCPLPHDMSYLAAKYEAKIDNARSILEVVVNAHSVSEERLKELLQLVHKSLEKQ